MTRKKPAEREFTKFASNLHWWVHKFQDVRYCPNSVVCENCGHRQICGQPIFMTDRDQAIETESIVDYLIFLGDKPFWIECKGKPGQTRFNFNEITDKQNSFLDDFTFGRGVLCALFITLGTKIPDRYAWLISWWTWRMKVWEAEDKGLKSFNYQISNRKQDKEMDMELFEPYKLIWQTNVGWTMPRDHALVKAYPYVLNLPPLRRNVKYKYTRQ